MIINIKGQQYEIQLYKLVIMAGTVGLIFVCGWYFYGKFKKDSAPAPLGNVRIEEPVKPSTPPNFSKDSAEKIISGSAGGYVLVLVKKSEGQRELWSQRIGEPEKSWFPVASGSEIAEDSPISSKAGYFFWLSPDRKGIYGIEMSSGSFLGTTIEEDPYSSPLYFGGGEWEVVFTGNKFAFRKVGTSLWEGSDGDISLEREFKNNNGL
jgi:hypothetical protein